MDFLNEEFDGPTSGHPDMEAQIEDVEGEKEEEVGEKALLVVNP